MVKRARTPSVEVKSVDDNGITIEFNEKEYYVNGGNAYVDLLTNVDVECSVIHNFEHYALLDIENIRSGENILRQEINPLKYKNMEDWVRDE